MRAALVDAASGRGSFILLVGDAGIGKTRLAEELAAAAVRDGVRVLWGRCPEDEGAPPYWPWTQVLQALDPRATERSAIADPGRRGSGSATPESARFRFFASVTSELRAAARQMPLLLVIEDLHWADASSLLLMEFAARDLAGARILVLGTARDGEPLRRRSVAETLARVPIRTIPLGGLNERDVRQLLALAGVTPPLRRLARLIHRHTEGNPFFVLEIASWIEHEGAAGGEWRDGTLPVPDSVRTVIARRLDRLSASARAVLRDAAVLGENFPSGLLARVGREVTDEGLPAALDESVRAGVVREVPGAGQYRFRHALIRHVLYTELSAGDRARLHAHAADALEAVYGAAASRHAAELAHHHARAGRLARPGRLTEYSRLAGEQALATHAYAEAAQHFERALTVRGHHAPDAEYAALLFGLGCSRAAASPRWNRQDAWDHLRRAAECFLEMGDIARAVAAATHPSITAEGATGVLTLVDRVLERVESASPAAGWLSARRGAALFFERGEYELAREALAHALAVARRTADAALELRTLAYATVVDHFAVHWPQVLESSRRVIELAREVDDPYAENYARYRASFALVFGGRAAEGRMEARANLERAEELGDEGLLLDALYINAALAQLQGDWDAARAIADRGLDEAPHHLPLLHLRTLLEFELGRDDAGEQFLDQLLEASRHAGPYPLRDAFRAVVIPQVAYATADPQRLEAPESSPYTGGVAGTLATAGRALTAILQRDVRAAAVELRRLEPLAGSIAAPLLVSDRLLGLLACTVGYTEQAVAYFERARVFNRSAGYRPELAWACYDLAHVLLDRGRESDTDRAASLLQEATETATSLGMHPLATRAAALHQRHRTTLARKAHRLTPRELGVLRLLATGRTNEQIAAHLSISANTVAVHVAHILAKTGSRNRTEAANYALRKSLA